MTPATKAQMVMDNIVAITTNRTIAMECSILFCNEMIKTFEAIVTKYSKDFQQSVDFWQEVKRELLAVPSPR